MTLHKNLLLSHLRCLGLRVNFAKSKVTQLLLKLLSPSQRDLQALSINLACLEFGSNNSKVVLKPRLGYVPKVLSTLFRAQVIELSALPPSTGSQELSLLCPVRALRVYIERSASYRKSEQLFVCFGNLKLSQNMEENSMILLII